MGRPIIEKLRGERINIKLSTEEERETYRSAKAEAGKQGLTIKRYTLKLYREDAFCARAAGKGSREVIFSSGRPLLPRK